MSDDGDKTCPLCAEEMDLTDQQLKPCKCGYEICVWCWHHIMEMAEKDETEGRCPACRTPYDKEKIVGTGANCERLVAEVSSERKVKPQKTKIKTSEGRKQLSSVRVIQRNLVYIVGLPLNLADEDLLQRREYFGQYGKVLKVSMSRTTAGAIQQFPNSTCSVYITYAKEEEAVRCIQLVHGFILDGRTLRACFGTTKYCHAWLRNVACTNPDCLYLHEVGSQEDSFTKDEIVSAFTRNRVQQITGGTNNMQQRSGSVLPPPAVDYCNSSSASTAKPILKNASNTTTSVARGSPPNGSSSKSLPLPAAAAWGAQTSNCQPTAAGLTCSNGHAKSKSNETTVTSAFLPAAVASTSQASLSPSGMGKKPTLDEESPSTRGKVKAEPLKSLRHANLDCPADMPEKSVTSDRLVSSLTSKDNDRGTSNITNSIDHSDQSASLDAEKGDQIALNGKTRNLSSYMSSMSIDRNASERTGVSSSSLFTDHGMTKHPSQASQQYYAEEYREPLTSHPASEPAPAQFGTYNGVCISAQQSNWDSDLNTQANSYIDVEEDVLSFDCQRLKDPEVVNHPMPSPNSTNLMHGANHCRAHSLQQSEAVNFNIDPIFVDTNAIERPHLYASNVSATSNRPPGYRENSAGAASLSRTLEYSFLHPKDGKEMQMERLQGGRSNGIGMPIDKGESCIISNILSMDFDVWDDSFTSPQNLAKLLGGSDKQSGPGKIPSPWKAQNSSQSRFSFARQEEPRDQPFDSDLSFSDVGQLDRNRSFSQNFAENGDSFLGKPGIGNVLSCSKFEGLDNFGCSQSAFSSSKLSAASRGHISAPPGFSAPSRAPPPGFSAQERMDQTFDPMPGNHMHDTSSLFRNSYQAPPSGNLGSTGDIEFMDPAILAVGKGRPQGGFNNAGLDMKSNFSQLSAFENEARLQLLMQRSVSQQPGLRHPDIGDSYSPLNDPYGISSRLMDQSHVNSLSPYPQLSLQQQSRNVAMSNGHWNRWSEAQNGNNLGMAELLRNERPGFNKFYTGYEDSKFQMPSSGDMYNRSFGM